MFYEDPSPRYPIYSFNLRWSEEMVTEDQKKYDGGWIEGLPEGRFWNRTGFTRMYKEPQTDESLEAELLEWWENYIVNKKIPNPKDLSLEIKYEGDESWCCSWFAHYTFDDGRSDADFLASFNNFVARKLSENEAIKYGGKDGTEYCLMGAEDRWRWYGTEDPDTHERTEAPCRCEGCKKRGVVIIGH